MHSHALLQDGGGKAAVMSGELLVIQNKGVAGVGALIKPWIAVEEKMR